MSSVGINPPHTPVTTGSNGIAKATLPNVCKMPGPPAPFVPSPLPNIAKSGNSPSGYSKTVKIEGNDVAIRGATFESIGDIASKGTGGGLISANTQGPAKFIALGSLTVKIEGKNVHLLSDQMLNNCGPSGSPPNTGATMMGLKQDDIDRWDDRLQQYVNECDQEVNDQWDKDHPNGPKHDDCTAPAGRGVFTSGKDKGKPIPVQVALGSDKEKCVYGKMGFPESEYGKEHGNANGDSVAVQQRVLSNGEVFDPAGGFKDWTGSIKPDVIYRSNGSVAAVRDLKFPCPSEAGKEGQWTNGQDVKYEELLGVTPELVFPI